MEDWIDDDDGAALVRLNKYLADHGIASRRKCDELIGEGKVIVDGYPCTELGTRIDPSKQTVEIDGVVLKPDSGRLRYYLLNKPRGVVCTNDRREARTRAIDLITDPAAGRIYTVGRLDEDSTGLILLTNDGEFTNLVAHPRHEVPKTYLVKVRGKIDADALAKIRRGVYLAEGRTSTSQVRIYKRTTAFTSLSISLHEGKNREVRRIFARVGFSVLTLQRTRIGNLSDRRLKEGKWRPLLRSEVADLIEIAHGLAEAHEEPSRGRQSRRPTSRGSRRPSGGSAAPKRRPASKSSGQASKKVGNKTGAKTGAKRTPSKPQHPSAGRGSRSGGGGRGGR